MPGLFDGTPLERPVTCQRCEKPLADCRCPRNARGLVTLPADQPLRIQRQTGGRAGKTVTIVLGLDPHATDIPTLLNDLKHSLGAGGAIKDASNGPALEIQGDHRERVLELLRARGYPAKPSGG